MRCSASGGLALSAGTLAARGGEFVECVAKGQQQLHREGSQWRQLNEGNRARPVLAVRGNQLRMESSYRWQAFAAQLMLSEAMRLQSDVWFCHGAAVSIGERGVMIAGCKGSGKTTLSLALAARSHGFLAGEFYLPARDARCGPLGEHLSNRVLRVFDSQRIIQTKEQNPTMGGRER
jgi:hypothetical protein